MTKNKYEIKNAENGKTTDSVDIDNAEKKREYSFFELYRYSTALDKFLLVLGLLGAVVSGMAQPFNIVLFGSLTGDIVNYASVTQNPNSTDVEIEAATGQFMDAIAYFAAMNAVIGLVMFVSSYLSVESFNYSVLRQVFKIRSEYLLKLLNQDIGWYDINETGDFASRMSEDIFKFEDGIGEKVPIFLYSQVLFITSLIVALVKGWELALICLTSLPAAIIVYAVISCLMSRFVKNELTAYSTAGSIAEEVISSIRTVIAFGGQRREIERYDQNLVFAKKNNIRRSMLMALGFGILWFLIYASYALAFWYGVGLVLRDRVWEDPVYTPGNMITVFFSVMTGTMNFGMSSPFIEAFGMAKAAGNRIFQIIDNIPVINLSKGYGEKIADMQGNIKFKNVHFHYPSRKNVPILRGLDIDINAGETVALVGSSGCGKSTVVQLIQRFYDPTAGEVFVDSRNLKDLDLTWFRNKVGVVGQEPILFATTIYDNIMLGNKDATEEEVKNAARRANAHEFIKALPKGYQTIVGDRGAQLSGGQKQRIAIARALVGKPSILLLDEATSALDNNSEAKVQAALDSVCKDCTTIIVAHRLSTIRGANKIIVFSEGKVVEQGTHEELMSLEGEYHSLVTMQVQSSSAVEQQDRRYSVVKSDDTMDNVSLGEEEIAEVVDEEDELKLDQGDSLIEVIKMNSPEWPQIVLGCIGSIIMGFGMPVIAILLGDIIGTFANHTDEEIRAETNKYSVYFIIAGVVSGISTFFQIYMFSIAGEKLTKRIRIQLFETMLQQEIGYFDKNSVGGLCSKLAADAALVQGATGQRLGTIFQSLSTLVFSVTISMIYEWRLGLVALAFTPLILLATFFETRNTGGLDKNRTESSQRSTKIAVESVGNVRTVSSLVCENIFHEKYIAELTPYHKSTLKATYWRSLVFGLSRSLMFFAYSACMYYGGFLIRDGLSYEKVFKVSQALIMGTVSIASALAFAPNFTKGLQAARNVRQLLTRVSRVKDSPSSLDKTKATGDVTYERIHFSYPTRPSVQVLRGLDLSVLQGKTVALVGPSGCGKSTIIQLIERFYDPNSGQVFLDESRLPSITLESLRSHLGIVSQEPNLFNKTIGENIAYGDNTREVGMSEIIEAAKNANIHNFVSSLPMGYDTPLGDKGTQLSGGQKQRIAIARALLRNPKVLLLDEATSALDAESEKIVQEALDHAKRGRTCITIAHRLTTIQDADLICVINEGIVAEMGTHSELLKQRGLYYKLHSHQHS